MSAYRKNVMVGITMLVALSSLTWMILKFGDAPAAMFADPTFPVKFISDRAEGVSPGSPVSYRGVEIGRITGIRLAENQRQVEIDAQIELSKPVPSNVIGRIVSQSALGTGSAISLQLTSDEPGPPLKVNAVLHAEFVGLDLLPPEFADLARDLRETSKQFRESNLLMHLDEAVRTIQQQAVKAGEIMDNMNKLVTDEKLRADLNASIANVRSVTETANRISTNLEKFSTELDQLTVQANATVKKTEGHIDDLAKQLSGRLEQTSKLLMTFQSISKKVDDGTGTAGMMVNDPKLYQALVDTTQELNATIKDLQRLVQQWEQEGATFRLK